MKLKLLALVAAAGLMATANADTVTGKSSYSNLLVGPSEPSGMWEQGAAGYKLPNGNKMMAFSGFYPAENAWYGERINVVDGVRYMDMSSDSDDPIHPSSGAIAFKNVTGLAATQDVYFGSWTKKGYTGSQGLGQQAVFYAGRGGDTSFSAGQEITYAIQGLSAYGTTGNSLNSPGQKGYYERGSLIISTDGSFNGSLTTADSSNNYELGGTVANNASLNGWIKYNGDNNMTIDGVVEGNLFNNASSVAGIGTFNRPNGEYDVAFGGKRTN